MRPSGAYLVLDDVTNKMPPSESSARGNVLLLQQFRARVSGGFMSGVHSQPLGDYM